MTRWATRHKRPKTLDARLVALALARGGMVLHRGGQWHVYRSADARRMRIGVVTDDLADKLVAEGIACRLEGLPLRLGAAPDRSS